ncbi:hypothetical protein EV421DRAFT_1859274 [Armillaria borealis]|uniref:Uncharacterized protein n=1 Tax=Armillaria borealis TaxID=47425 RepID=A0AA39MD24_9AGAR|nr:hypothetical protein EV421DRAFT_1859274 [Armillaria borealis]
MPSRPVKYWLGAGQASTFRLRNEDGVGPCCMVARIFSTPRCVRSPMRRVCSTARRVSTWTFIWKTLIAISMRPTHNMASSLRVLRSSARLPMLTSWYRLTASRTSVRQVSSSRNAALTLSGSGAESSRPCRNSSTVSRTLRRLTFTLSHSLLHASTSSTILMAVFASPVTTLTYGTLSSTSQMACTIPRIAAALAVLFPDVVATSPVVSV